MAGETTTPLLPCAAIDEITGFYEALGFRTTYRQRRPNGYVVVAREDLVLHFFSIDGFVPADSYGSCLVGVPDATALYAAFREGLRTLYGRIPTNGIPRLTRPRKGQDGVTGFALIDLGGNWIRVYQQARVAAAPAAEAPPDESRSALRTALDAAMRLGDSKDDPETAARVIDTALAREDSAAPADQIAALSYRAELAIRLGDRPGAAQLLEQHRAIPLDDATRDAAQGDLERADDLRQILADPE
jgi:hypothetical protein